jgi:hypothetical protein
MLLITKHIILVGDNTRRLVTLQRCILEMAPETVSYITDICSIREVLCSQPADMILVCTVDTGWFPYVQRIRQEPLADKIAVFVCCEPLAEAVLEKVLMGHGKY